MQAMVLTVIGKDKAGLIKQLSECVTACEGNWLKSSFCHLAGQFAGFVEVMLPFEQHNELIRRCHAIANLHITLVPANNTESDYQKQIRLNVTGNDRQGIVSNITTTLKGFNVNIQEMQTRCESAPNWGSKLFIADLLVYCEDSIDGEDLKQSIEDLADDLMVEII